MTDQRHAQPLNAQYLDAMYLEWSQFTGARNKRELAATQTLQRVENRLHIVQEELLQHGSETDKRHAQDLGALRLTVQRTLKELG